MKRVLAACKANNIPCDLTTDSVTVELYLEEGDTFVSVDWWSDAEISREPANATEIARRVSARADD
jgi:hypothetical protein